MTAREQIDNLARFIMDKVLGEPSCSESAVDCAIRIIRELQAKVGELEAKLQERTEALAGMPCLGLLWFDREWQETEWYEIWGFDSEEYLEARERAEHRKCDCKSCQAGAELAAVKGEKA